LAHSADKEHETSLVEIEANLGRLGFSQLWLHFGSNKEVE